MYFILCILVIFFSTSNVYSQPSKLQQCRLPNLNPLDDVAIGFPRISNRVRTTGLLNITVLFVDFQDAPATLTPQQVFSIISPEAENFFYVSSYGKLTLRLIPHLRWLRMSRVSTSYNMSQSVTPVDQKAFINEAISLATNVDFSTSDEVVVLTNPAARAIRYGQTFAPKRGNGITVRGRTFENAINSGFDLPNWGSFWLNRELSHTMGLPDLYAFSGNGPLLGFTGGWSLMGNINGVGREYFGWERWLMGWLSNSQVVCVTKKGVSSTTLSPIEIGTGLGAKIVVVPLTNHSALVVESRRPIGYDKTIKPGVLTYLVDSSIRTGAGPIRVLPLNSQDSLKQNATLSVGRSISYRNVKVYFTYTSNRNDQVYIIRS